MVKTSNSDLENWKLEIEEASARITKNTQGNFDLVPTGRKQFLEGKHAAGAPSAVPSRAIA
jgi:hypothetical protein